MSTQNYKNKDGNNFDPEIEYTICKAGFNPDTFWRRPAYAKRCISDMLNDIKIIDDDTDELSIRFEKTIKAIEGSIHQHASLRHVSA